MLIRGLISKNLGLCGHVDQNQKSMDRFLTKPPADSSSGSGSGSSSSSSSGGKKKKAKKSNTKNCEQILNDLMRSNPQPDTDGVHFNTFPPSLTNKNGKRSVKTTADGVPRRCVFGTKVRLDITEIGRKQKGGISDFGHSRRQTKCTFT